jgi:preprotein translocase subunit Sss1
MIDWEEIGIVIGYSLLGLVIVGGIGAIIALQIAYIVS